MGLLQSFPAVRAPAPGVALIALPEPRFKRATLSLHFDAALDERRAARTVLMDVLTQGSAAHPTRRALAARLQEAWGAQLQLDGGRVAERHRCTLRMDWIGERFLPEEADVVEPVLALGREVLEEPARGEDGAPFRADVVARERAQTLRWIASLRDDKPYWAELRFLQAMCGDEPYGRSSWDSAEAVEEVDATALEDARRALLGAPVTAVAVGPLDPARVEAHLAQWFAGRAEPEAPAPVERRRPERLREVREHLPMDQAQFHFGFRYLPDPDPRRMEAMALAALVLGGGVSGRLFRVVREQMSLAYGIHAGLRAAKGLLTVSAGIDAGAHERVRDEVLRQVEDLAENGPSDEELAHARMAVLDRLHGLGDAPTRLAGYLAREDLLRARRAPADRARLAEEITPQEVAAAAAEWLPDTVYLLSPEPAVTPAAS